MALSLGSAASGIVLIIRKCHRCSPSYLHGCNLTHFQGTAESTWHPFYKIIADCLPWSDSSLKSGTCRMVGLRHSQLTLNHDFPVKASSSNNSGCRKDEKNCMGALDRRTGQKPILELRSKSHIPSLNVNVTCIHFYAHFYLPRTKYHVFPLFSSRSTVGFQWPGGVWEFINGYKNF